MKFIRLVLGALAALWLASVHAQGEDVATIVGTACAKCHGMDGNSTSPKIPKLAGQHKGYLLGQLKAYRDQSRKGADAHAYISGNSQKFDDTMLAKLVDHFAAQKQTRNAPGDAQLEAKGKAIFENGIASKKVPPCVLCHARGAAGMGIVPRLAGQHREYLVKQIKVFHSDDRPVYARIMKSVVKKLSDDEAEQVATYLQGL